MKGKWATAVTRLTRRSVQEGLDAAMKRVEEEQTSTCEEKTNAALALAAVARVTREHFSEHVDDAVGVRHQILALTETLEDKL